MAAPSPSLEALLAAQRTAFRREGPPPAQVRRNRIDRLILLLTANAHAFSDALNADFGNRPAVVSLASDIAGILPDLTYTRRHLKRWMRTDVIAGSFAAGLPTIVEKRPLGVVGIIGPWNFPIGLTAQPAASAFAAGNRVMIKFSEVTARTAEVFAAKAGEYFDPAEFTVVTGGADIGAQFSSLPFDHIFFTGSPQVGALVAQAAARNLVPVTLELGGKNPAVVAPNADIPETAFRIMSARLVNGGQLCLCPDYAFVPGRHIEEFISKVLTTAESAATAEHGAGLVSIVDDKNFARVTALIEDARAHGARVIQPAGAGDVASRRIPPTILLGVTDAMRVSREEVFGPVLAVHGYDDLSTVWSYIASRPTPLAAYWFGPKDHDFRTFRRNVASGGMTVNDFAAHNAVLGAPFGGLGTSGWGAYHGKTGFDTFSHHRTITTNRMPVGLAKVLTPPYPRGLQTGLRAYIGWQRRTATRRLSRGGYPPELPKGSSLP
jgi:coniferyl-aldehyde dehydrogenase